MMQDPFKPDRAPENADQWRYVHEGVQYAHTLYHAFGWLVPVFRSRAVIISALLGGLVIGGVVSRDGVMELARAILEVF